jgi:anti-sigma regulatory factor (Ser/Thr protein kinase)
MSDIIYRGLTMDDITVIVIDVGLDIFKNKKNLSPTSALLISSNASMLESTGRGFHIQGTFRKKKGLGFRV